jgi:hypothetical protein
MYVYCPVWIFKFDTDQAQLNSVPVLQIQMRQINFQYIFSQLLKDKLC